MTVPPSWQPPFDCHVVERLDRLPRQTRRRGTRRDLLRDAEAHDRGAVRSRLADRDRLGTERNGTDASRSRRSRVAVVPAGLPALAADGGSVVAGIIPTQVGIP